MKKHTLQSDICVYDSSAELPEPDNRLLQNARAAIENAYAPYSHFSVGAAVLMSGGAILTGANYENAAYPLCICAEQSVLAAAASRFPGQAVVAIAIAVASEGKTIDRPAAPCGACRQVICETERKNGHTIRIVLQGESGPVITIEKGADLLPLAFDGTFL